MNPELFRLAFSVFEEMQGAPTDADVIIAIYNALAAPTHVDKELSPVGVARIYAGTDAGEAVTDGNIVSRWPSPWHYAPPFGDADTPIVRWRDADFLYTPWGLMDVRA